MQVAGTGRAAVCNNALFVLTCVNEAIADEARWPSQEEQRALGQIIPQLLGCVGIMDKTLVKIRTHYENPRNKRWY